jgi:hypothetical protein
VAVHLDRATPVAGAVMVAGVKHTEHFPIAFSLFLPMFWILPIGEG